MTDIRKLVEDAKTRSNPTSELDRFVDAHRDAPQYEVFEALQGLADKIRELEANLETEKENFALFRDKVAVPALQHAHEQLNERDGEDPTIAWVVDLMHEHDEHDNGRVTDARFFHTEEEARRFVDAISTPQLNTEKPDAGSLYGLFGWVVTNCYEITKSKMSKSAYDALKKFQSDD